MSQEMLGGMISTAVAFAGLFIILAIVDGIKKSVRQDRERRKGPPQP